MPYLRHYITGIKNYSVFRGRASRAEFWWFTLVLYGINLAITLIVGVVLGEFLPVFETVSTVLVLVHLLGTALPHVAVAARRLHDTGRSGWWTLLLLVPFFGGIALLIFLMLPSEAGQNRYGEQPGSGATFLDWRLFYQWVLANTVGAVAGASVWLAWNSNFDEFDARAAGIVSLISLMVTGVMTILLQWLVLRRHLVQAGWWALATGAGFLINILTPMLTASLTVDVMIEASQSGSYEAFAVWNLVLAATSGAVLGILQWLVLRRQVAQAGWWVPASIACFVAGILVAAQVVVWIDSTMRDISWVVVDPFVGISLILVIKAVVYGAIIGLALILLLSRPHPVEEREKVELPWGSHI